MPRPPRLFDDLTRHFGADAVFMDVATIEPGIDFRRVIDEQIAACGVLLTIVGRSWLTAQDEAGRRRLDDPSDFVRLETGSALKRDIPVVPVLVNGANMPRAEDLPADLKEFAFRNAVELRHASWNADVQALMKALRRHVPAAPGAASADLEAKPPGRKLMSAAIAGAVAVALAAVGLYVWWPRPLSPRDWEGTWDMQFQFQSGWHDGSPMMLSATWTAVSGRYSSARWRARSRTATFHTWSASS